MSLPIRRIDPEQQRRAERDLRLVAAFRGGRADAFDEIVASYDRQVSRILAQLGAAPTEAEDLAQEVFLRIFRNLHRFRGQSSFYTWLYRITVNVFFDHNKKRKRADVRLKRLESALGDASVVRTDGDPYVACFESLTQATFAGAIGQLPETFRAVVRMREIEDLSYEEIARLTGISIGTVRSRLSRARTRLKELLREAIAPVAA